MKIISKVLVLVLSAIMVLAMSASVFAAGDGKITINNAVDGETYTAYKLLDAQYESEDSEAIAYYYTGTAEDELYMILVKYFKFGSFSGGKAYLKVGSDIDYSNVDVAALASEINTAMKRTSSPLQLTVAGSDVASGGKATISELERGYYFVDTTLGSLCSIDTAKTVEMYEKNTEPQLFKGVLEDSDNTYYTDTADEEVFKTQGFATADRNQEVTFKLVTVLGTNNNQGNGHNNNDSGTGIDYDYVITDTLAAKTTYVADSFAIDGWTAGTDYTVTESNGVLTITLKASKLSTLDQAAKIEMTYKAKVAADAPVNTAMTNKAKLKYSAANETEEVSATVKTYGFDILKVDGNDTSTKLEGVKFTLQNAAGKYWNATDNDWSDTEYEFSTNEDGSIVVEGLDGDSTATYTLAETETIIGYNPLEGTVTVSIDKDGKVTVTGASASGTTVTIENFSGTVLPGTGGIGTTIFYILGSALVIGCGIVLISRKRMNNK